MDYNYGFQKVNDYNQLIFLLYQNMKYHLTKIIDMGKLFQ